MTSKDKGQTFRTAGIFDSDASLNNMLTGIESSHGPVWLDFGYNNAITVL